MKQNKRDEVEAMTIICNIQQMQYMIYGEQFTYEQFNGNSIEELRTLQEQIIQEYNQSVKIKQVLGYLGLATTLKCMARIITDLGDSWTDADMKAICKRDAAILTDAAEKVNTTLEVKHHYEG